MSEKKHRVGSGYLFGEEVGAELFGRLIHTPYIIFQTNLHPRAPYLAIGSA